MSARKFTENSKLKEGSSGGCGGGGLAERDAELLLPWSEGAYI